jgi:2-methylcitrate dehydratase PrpD
MGGSGAGILGTDIRVAPPWAALVNGAMGHMAEMDDTHRGTMSHPGDALWATALAMTNGKHDGDAFLAAAIAGYEVALRIGEAVMPEHYRRGWHTSGTIMAFGSAVTAALLLGLDAQRTAWALGTAAAQASGNFAHLTERAMTKDFNCGHAAKCGVIAALLAQEGFSGPTDVIENPKGFMRLYGGEVFPEKLLAGLGRSWRILEVAHKPYSACRHIHASLDALQTILAERKLGHADVAHVTARIFSTGAAYVDDPQPWTEGKGLQGARFSAQLNLAVLLRWGQEGLLRMMDGAHTQKALHAPELREAMRRIDVVSDKELDANFPDQWSSVVIVEDQAGHRFQHRVDHPLGEPEFPMSDRQLRDKFDQLLAQAGWSAQRAERVWNAVARPGSAFDLRAALPAIMAA